jgi:hypothetical protein
LSSLKKVLFNVEEIKRMSRARFGVDEWTPIYLHTVKEKWEKMKIPKLTRIVLSPLSVA